MILEVFVFDPDILWGGAWLNLGCFTTFFGFMECIDVMILGSREFREFEVFRGILVVFRGFSEIFRDSNKLKGM